jgi:hypothetical protein
MKVGIFDSKGVVGKTLLNEFEVGLIEKNEDYFYVKDGIYDYCDVAVVFGMYSKKFKDTTNYRKLIRTSQLNQGKEILIIEKGFLNRDKYFSVGLNNQTGKGIYFNENMPSDRFNALDIDVKPWTIKGKNIILCGQIYWDTSVQHIDYKKWLQDTAKELRKLTDKPIIYRPHPKRPESISEVKGLITSTKSYQEDLKDAFAVVAFNSNSALEAMIEGVPAFVYDKGSMVYNIANRDIKDINAPYYNYREQTLYNIAYTQWNKEEMRSGQAWEHIKKGLINNK